MKRLRALGSLVLLVAFEAAAWLALQRAGTVERWHVDWSHFWRWADQTPPGDVAAGLVRVAAVVIVAWLALSTTLYLLGTITRFRALVRLTGPVTLPGVRRLVERAAVVGFSASMLLPHAAMAQQPAGGWAPPGTAVTIEAPAPATEPVVVVPAVAPTDVQQGRWVVAHGDNLWTIAEEAIAEARGVDVADLRSADVVPYWRELIRVNQDRLVSGDPNLIYAPERIVLPPLQGADVQLSQEADTPPAAPAAPAEPERVIVTPPAPAPELPALESPASTPVTQPVVTTPTTAAQQPVDDDADLAAPVATVAPDRPADGAEAPDAAPSVKHVGTQQHAGLNVGRLMGYGLLCAGIAAAVLRRRRPHARRRLAGEVIPALTPETAATEMAVLVGADVAGARFLDAGLRAFAGIVGEPGAYDPMDLPSPIGVVLGPDRMEIVLAKVTPAPEPFAGSGSRWVLNRSVGLSELEQLADGAPVPTPALVSLGRDPDGAEVLLDLEDPGLVAITGDGPDGMATAAEIVTAAGIQLATTPWGTEFVRVVLVGFDAPPAADNITAVDDLDEALFDQLEDEAERVGSRVKAARPACDTTYDARIHRVVPDAWTPTVVVCARPLPDNLARRLLGLVNDPVAHGLGALVVGRVPEAPWEMHVGPAGLRVESLDVTVTTPQRITSVEAAGLRDLLEAAEAEPVRAPDRDVSRARDTDDPEVLVRVLGQVAVDGVPAIGRAKSVEALVYLVTHRERDVDGDVLIEALWPGSNPEKSRGTMQTTTWKLRQVLGLSSTGQPHMRDLKGGERLYGPALARTVASDLDVLESALTANERDRLEAALALVRGEPFQRAGRGYEWATSDGLVARAQQVVVDAAHRLAELCLADQDTERARWAARQGLLAVRGHEQLMRDLMRAEALRGNRAGLVAIHNEAAAAAEADDVELDPTTAELYGELLARVS